MDDLRLPGLAGSVVLVTGASGGIGGQVARVLSQAGATVALHHRRDSARLRSVAEGLGGASYQQDLLEPGAADALVRAVEADLGPVDLLVNNAGDLTRATIAATGDALWAETLHVHLTVPFQMIRALVPGMCERRRGAVVNVASIAGVNGGTMGPAYAAAKGGLIALTKSAARETGPSGVRVNAVAPTLTDTPMLDQPGLDDLARRLVDANPTGRLAAPAEVASAVLFLCSDLASYVNGECLMVTGGP